MGQRFNSPPGWPPPPEGFVPPPGWQPDPSWPPAPAGWQFWTPDGEGAGPAGTAAAGPPGAMPSYPAGPSAWGAQPPGGMPPQGYASPPPAVKPGVSGMAITAFVLGICGVTLLSVIFALVALARIRREPQRGKGYAVAGLAASGAWLLVLVLVIAAAPTPPARTPSGSIASKGTASVYSLRPGDCFQNPGAAQAAQGVTTLSVVPCAQRHNAQVFAEFSVPGTAYPGGTAMLKDATTGCQSRLSGRVDTAKITRTMSLHFLYPQPFSWAQGHRVITCILQDSTTDLTSSLLVPGAAG